VRTLCLKVQFHKFKGYESATNFGESSSNRTHRQQGAVEEGHQQWHGSTADCKWLIGLTCLRSSPLVTIVDCFGQRRQMTGWWHNSLLKDGRFIRLLVYSKRLPCAEELVEMSRKVVMPWHVLIAKRSRHGSDDDCLMDSRFFNVLLCVVGQYRFFYDIVLSAYAKNCCKTDTIIVIMVIHSALLWCWAVEIKSKLKGSNL
jgi:hypothetical protein